MSASLLFAGDLYVAPGEHLVISERLAALIRRHDGAFINLEAPVAGTLRPEAKAGPALGQDAGVIEVIRAAGFTGVTLANNHLLDAGPAGLSATVRALGDLLHAGAGADADAAFRPMTVQCGQLRVAILAVAEAGFGVLLAGERGPGVAWIRDARCQQAVRRAVAEHDAVVIVAHGGVEEIDVPLPEWRAVYRAFLDLGVAAVIAHHPHVPQGWERYGRGVIAYSLGNFCFSAQITSPHPYWRQGLAATVRLSGGDAADLELHPLAFTCDHQVDLASGTGLALHLDHLHRQLADETAYQRAVDDACLTLWHERYAAFYQDALGGRGWRRLARRVLQILGRRSRTREQMMLWHLLHIESHRWAAQRGLWLAAGRGHLPLLEGAP